MNSIPVHRAPVSSLRGSPSAFDLAPTPLIILHGTAVTAVLSTNQAARLRPSHFCGLQASCQSAKLLLLITAIRTSAQIPVLFARSNRFADTYPVASTSTRDTPDTGSKTEIVGSAVVPLHNSRPRTRDTADKSLPTLKRCFSLRLRFRQSKKTSPQAPNRGH